MTVLATKVSN